MKIRLPQVSEYVAPNLIPLIDIMFLLLIFFIFGGDLGQRELEDVRLPLALSIKECMGNHWREPIPINAYHRTDVTCPGYARRIGCPLDDHWKLDIRGHDCTDARVMVSVLRKELSSSDEDRHRILLRSDAAAPFGLAQRAMNACASLGIYRIDAAANLPIEPSCPRPVLPKRTPRPRIPEPTIFEKLFPLGGEPEKKKENEP